MTNTDLITALVGTDSVAEQAARLWRSIASPESDGEFRSAFDELCRVIGPRLHRIARARGIEDNDACELSQNTMIRVLRQAHTLRESTSFFAWIETVFRNEHSKECRRNRRRPHTQQIDPNIESHDVTARQMEASELITRLLDQISPEDCELLQCRMLETTYEEIALALKASPDALRKRYERLRKQLRQKYGWLFPETESETDHE